MENANYCIIYNPLSGNGRGEAEAKALCEKLGGVEFADMTKIESYSDFFSTHKQDIIICGGDGTLNRFANDTSDVEFDNHIYYYATGTGNDFLRDINGNVGEMINVDKHLKNLPVCTVNGKDYKFINGIGFGIAGYCCEVGDKLRLESDKPINYAGIAIKGVLGKYKPTNAKITVDGVEYNFKKVWTAPAMVGRFYGGGIMPTPAQDRFNEDGTLSVLIFHGTCRLRTLMIFPSIFSGKHLKYKKAITVLTGKEITVEFDSPRALQVDGETFLGITKHTVKAAAKVKQEQNV